jgi:NAD(P)-dependent dehydrogenase (short-subunit alcohol dehydrogenase family)
MKRASEGSTRGSTRADADPASTSDHDHLERQPAVALVTGASRGIGAATARRLTRNGLAVAVNYRSDRPAAASVAEGIQAEGGAAIVAQADVTDAAAVRAMVARVEEALGPIGVLVCNTAAVGDPAFGAFVDVAPDESPWSWGSVPNTAGAFPERWPVPRPDGRYKGSEVPGVRHHRRA